MENMKYVEATLSAELASVAVVGLWGSHEVLTFADVVDSKRSKHVPVHVSNVLTDTTFVSDSDLVQQSRRSVYTRTSGIDRSRPWNEHFRSLAQQETQISRCLRFPRV